MKWLVFFFLSTGFLGALFSVFSAVDVSGDANVKAIRIFEMHHLLAFIVLILSGITAMLRLIFIKWFRPKYSEYLLFTITLIIAACISTTGHLGAQLVYIYSIGPQGNGLI